MFCCKSVFQRERCQLADRLTTSLRRCRRHYRGYLLSDLLTYRSAFHMPSPPGGRPRETLRAGSRQAPGKPRAPPSQLTARNNWLSNNLLICQSTYLIDLLSRCQVYTAEDFSRTLQASPRQAPGILRASPERCPASCRSRNESPFNDLLFIRQVRAAEGF